MARASRALTVIGDGWGLPTSNAFVKSRLLSACIGLQLEMSPEFRDELVESLDGDRVQWNSFRKAVRAICRLDLNGVRGCLLKLNDVRKRS